MIDTTTIGASAVTARSATHMSCAHCGEPVPLGLVNSAAELQFCCAGCESVHRIIHRCGLDRYYRLRQEVQGRTAPARQTVRRFSEFDDPAFQRLYVRSLGPSVSTVELFLPAVHCAACVWLVEKLPRVRPGVIEARLDLRRALVCLVWNHREVPLSAIARALASLGYEPTPARQAGMREARQREDRRQIIRLGVAAACAGNVMLLALAMYAGMFDAIEAPYLRLFRWASMSISLLALAWPGSVFFKGAWNALRARSLNLDLPIALGLGAGAVWGVVATVQGAGEIYFDSLSVLVFALLLGRFVQTRQQRWSADSVELLFSLTPTSARIAEDAWAQNAIDVPIEAVQKGMIVEVLAGDSVPVDGMVVRGSSQVDQSLLTGESAPVHVREGMGVAAGTVNLSSTLRIRVEATGESTRVGRLMRMVEDASQRRAPIVRHADRLAGWFVAAMLVLAALTAGMWALIDPSRAIDLAVSLLIVTCPCALGLATPLAMTVAIGRAARRGILVKGGDSLQRLAQPGIIFLDKTGTITAGRQALVKWIGDEAVKPLVAAVEANTSHPIGRALVRDLGGQPTTAGNIRQTVGGGIEGSVGSHRVVVGSPAFVRARCTVDQHQEFQTHVQDLLGDSLTPVLVAVDDRIVAAAGIGDPLRDDATAAVDALRRAGWDVRILSGDHSHIVGRVGSAIGIEGKNCMGEAGPEQKLHLVQQAMARLGTSGPETPVVMVGDGVNDAAALAAAHVGIATHGGAEASLAAADVYLHAPGLMPLVNLIAASRRTLAVIHRNLAVSLMYNTVAATLAVAGVINPLVAAILMPASSLTVVGLSWRSRMFSDRLQRERAANPRPGARPCP